MYIITCVNEKIKRWNIKYMYYIIYLLYAYGIQTELSETKT